MRFHFLHIRKAGGTAIKSAVRTYIQQTGNDVDIVLHPHNVTMRQALSGSADDKIFFVVRDPVSRFVSGFNSRLRKGRPRLDREWTRDEEQAFASFHTPNDLAIALGQSGEKGEAARKAIAAIPHTATGLSFWLGSSAYLEKNRSRIAFIGDLPNLDPEIATLRRAVGVTDDFRLPDDALERHETPEGFDRSVSREADSNIRDWYQADGPILEWCAAFRALAK